MRVIGRFASMVIFSCTFITSDTSVTDVSWSVCQIVNEVGVVVALSFTKKVPRVLALTARGVVIRHSGRSEIDEIILSFRKVLVRYVGWCV